MSSWVEAGMGKGENDEFRMTNDELRGPCQSPGMNWIDQMLEQAWKSRPRGGQEPFVVYRDGREDPSLHELRSRLSAAAHAQLGAAAAALSEWASTGRWPRSAARSGWCLRSYLSWACQSAHAVPDTTAASPASPPGSDQRAAWLQGDFYAWAQAHLPALLADLAEQEHTVLSTLRLAA
jgi:hypothetical protein